jgi:hypothetical protein
VLKTEDIEKWAKELLNFSERLLGKVGAAISAFGTQATFNADSSEYDKARMVSVGNFLTS